jgi:hypothetical protein
MFHDINDFNGAVNDIELYEEWFTTHGHKIIVKTINALKAKAMSTSMEMVLYQLERNQQYNAMEDVINACCATPVGSPHTFNSYLDVIKGNKKDSLRRAI